MTEWDKKRAKSIALYAAAGAIIAIPLPIVGPFLGAAAGAGFGYYKAKKKGSFRDQE